METLKHLLVVLKFWVPYDDKYSYKVFGYVLKEGDPDYIWQSISQEDTQVLISNLFHTLTDFDNKRVDRLFADYNHMK